MRFGRVQGHGRRDAGGQALSILVALDTGRDSRVLVNDSVPWLEFGPPEDVAWQIDQRTQEAIGSILAQEGWEAISQVTDDGERAEDELVHSPVYIVRNITVDFPEDPA